MICHASIDENGKTVGLIPGDQTMKEVCIRTFYKGPWNYMLRCTDASMRKRISAAMQLAANNNNIGYSQKRRNSLLNTVRNLQYNPGAAKIPCDCDCSSLVTLACIYAGIPEKQLITNGNSCTTANLRTKLIKTGKFQVFTDKKYLDNDQYLLEGDILIREPGHVVVNITDGKLAASTQTTEIKAIDISKYNTITNYTNMIKEVPNVFIRVGYRSYEKGILTEDPLFKKHMDNCVANGATIGIYYYDQSINEAEAEEQAVWVVNKLQGYKIDLPVFIDSEYSNYEHNGRADNISKEQRTLNIIAFCEKIKSAGFTPGVYASDSWFKSMVEFDKLKNYIIWCARYSTNKPTINKYDIWQYGSENYSWATGAIDTNIIYSDLKCTQTGIKPAVIPISNTQSGITPEKAILLMGQVNIKEGTLNVRKAPSTNSQVVLQLQKDAYVQLRGDLGDWYRMDIGYVSKKYIKEVHGIVTGDNLRVRSTPDTSLQTNIITTLPVNTEVIICTAGNGWYYVLLDDGRTGWVSGMYITLK